MRVQKRNTGCDSMEGTANALNKQLWTVSKRWTPILWVGQVAASPHSKINTSMLHNVTQILGCGRLL
jgi:hypothetical protein